MEHVESQKPLEVLDWGCISYDASQEQQKCLVETRLAPNGRDRLILTEHPKVITLGSSGDLDDLRISKTFLRSQGVAVFASDRGGKATFHGPGQMVAYPIIKLTDLDLHWYVHTLLTAVADLLTEYGLTPEFKEGQPGIWVAKKKIASIGIAVKQGITSHGVALNVNMDMSAFEWIIPCGHPDEVMTSMEKELGRPVDLETVKQRFVLNFKRCFGYHLRPESHHPDWLHLSARHSPESEKVAALVKDLHLETVCQSAHCPNLIECFSRGVATFMILGENCTRRCRFCAVAKGPPDPLDPGEPFRVAEAVKRMGLAYVVITSVTRDDLPDGGADQFIRTQAEIRRVSPKTRVEILVPDFQGAMMALTRVCESRPDMFNHNIETVPRLYPSVRPQARFLRSLDVLSFAADHGLCVKSGLMLGLGERPEEVAATLAEIKKTGCDYLTLGQYLAPSKEHVPMDRYVPPSEFDQWAETARSLGFREVAAGPLVRSSYRAEQFFHCAKNQDRGEVRKGVYQAVKSTGDE